jgi:outer membrane protein TolC
MLLLLLVTIVGCIESKRPLHYLGEADLEYYKESATEIADPDLDFEMSADALGSEEPRTLLNARRDEIWELSLTEAIHVAMANSTIIRSEGALSPTSPRLSNPDTIPTIYDPAIQETGVLFGRRGVEAALSDFDTQFTTSMLWAKNETVQNNPFFGGTPGSTLTQDSGQFRAGVSKQFATGGTFNIGHNWDYSGVNSTATLFPSSYVGTLGASYRHPLLAGSGVEFTRIAGPIRRNFGAITGVSQGVTIARINQDLSLADFEMSVRNLLFDVEKMYWDLYLAYRLYDAAITARNSALRSWREAKHLRTAGGGRKGFKNADEAQARDQYFLTRTEVEKTLSTIYTEELELRRLLGLPVNDGRVIRPAEEPTSALFVPDWRTSVAEALTRRTELRKQKWNIKSLSLQLRAARGLVRPKLDFVSNYRVNAFGDRLFGSNDKDGLTLQGHRSAYESLSQGNQTGWNMGFEFSMPLGFRSAEAQVRNYELRLAKARDVLASMELDISHEIASVMQFLALRYKTAKSSHNRRVAALERVKLFTRELEAGTVTLDEVLRAQASVAQAERDYYTSLVEYNKEIALYQFRKGTMLDHYNVHLAEGGWSREAYQDALRRAWSRSYAIDSKIHHTEPEGFAIPRFKGHVEMAPMEYEESLQFEEAPQLQPAPPADDNENRNGTSLPPLPTPDTEDADLSGAAEVGASKVRTASFFDESGDERRIDLDEDLSIDSDR